MRKTRRSLSLALIFFLVCLIMGSVSPLTSRALAAPTSVSGQIDDGVASMIAQDTVGHVMLSSNGTIYTSTDRGRTWQQLTVLSDATGHSCLTSDASNNFYILYAASPTSGMFRWRMRQMAWNGSSWTTGNALDVSSDATLAPDCAANWDSHFNNVHMVYSSASSSTSDPQLTWRAFRVAQNSLLSSIYLGNGTSSGSTVNVSIDANSGNAYVTWSQNQTNYLPMVISTLQSSDGNTYSSNGTTMLCAVTSGTFPPQSSHMCDMPNNASATVDDNGNVVVAIQTTISGVANPYQSTLSVVTYTPSTKKTSTVVLANGIYYYRPAITKVGGNLYVFAGDLLGNNYYQYQKATGRWTGLTFLPFSSSLYWPMKAASGYYDGIWVAWKDKSTQTIHIGSILAPDAPTATTAAPVSWANLSEYLLTWNYSNPNSDDPQGAYRLTVTDARGNTVVDTGKVQGTDTYYDVSGFLLQSGQPYTWQVTTWDAWGDMQGSWSSVGSFTP